MSLSPALARPVVTLARGLAHFGRVFTLVALAAQGAMVVVGLTWVAQGRSPLDNFLANEGLLFALSLALGLSLRWWCGRLLEATEWLRR